VVDDLKLSGQKKETITAAVKAYQAEVRKLRSRARADLLEKMRETLSQEEFTQFRRAVDRPPGRGGFRGRGGR
jgi:hypothetical protein